MALSKVDILEMREGLLGGDRLLGIVLGNGVVVLPAVVDGLGDAGARDGSTVDVWVQDSEEGDVARLVSAEVVGGGQALVDKRSVRCCGGNAGVRRFVRSFGRQAD